MLTGYGLPTKIICTYLHKQGWDVMMLGQQSIGSNSQFPCGGHCDTGITVLPAVKHHTGNEDLSGVVRKYRRNVMIMHHDLWGWRQDFFVAASRLMDFVFYGPIDHSPLSPYMISRLQRPICTLALPQTHFGKQQIDAVTPNQGIMPPTSVIPMSVDCNVFKPMPELKKRRDDEGKTRVIYVKANKGDRANFPGLMKSFKWFLKEWKVRHGAVPTPKEVELYLHTEPDTDQGYELKILSRMLGLEEYVRWPEDYCSDPACLGPTDSVGVARYCKICHKPAADLEVPAEFIATMFNYSHVQVNSCMGEGFGIPIVEALACGTPTFHTDWAGGAEHIPPEWRIPITQLYTTRLLADQAFPDEEKMRDIMMMVHEKRVDWLPKAQEQARRIGLSYDEKVVLPLWDPIMQQLDEREQTKRAAKWGPVEVPA